MIEKIVSYPTWAYKKNKDRWASLLYTFILLTGERKATSKEISLSFRSELRKVYTVSKIAKLYGDNIQVYNSSPSDPVGKKIYGQVLQDWTLLGKMSSRTKGNIFRTIFSV